MRTINIQPEDWQRITGEYTHLPTKVLVAPQALTKHEEDCLRIGKLLMEFLQGQRKIWLHISIENDYESLVLLSGNSEFHVHGCDVEDGNIADMLERAVQKFEEEELL